MSNITWIRDAHGHYQFETPPKADTILEIAASILQARISTGDCFTKPDDVRRFLEYKIGALEYEVFCCLFLNCKHHLIQFEEMFRGTVDGASVYPREIVKRALELNAAAVIFGHNHPSGITEPSEADRRLTRRLKDALSLLDIRTLDHFIVGSDTATSFQERGFL